MRTGLVDYKGVLLECTYEYDPAESRTNDSPGCPAEAHLYSCKVIAGTDRRVEIIEMLTGRQVEEIETMLEEGVESEREDWRIAA